MPSMLTALALLMLAAPSMSQAADFDPGGTQVQEPVEDVLKRLQATIKKIKVHCADAGAGSCPDAGIKDLK